MTNEEYLAIVENPKATLSPVQIYLMLREIKRDAESELEIQCNVPQHERNWEKIRWLCGDINGLDIAINLLGKLELK